MDYSILRSLDYVLFFLRLFTRQTPFSLLEQSGLAWRTGENTAETHSWLDEHLHKLKHNGPDEILVEIKGLQEKFPEKQRITNNLAYLEKRKEQMRYQCFRHRAFNQEWQQRSG